jgi:hypothetical protein
MRAKCSNCKPYIALAPALPLRSAVMFRDRLMIPLKPDHPRPIDHVIDFFGERRPSSTAPPPTPANLAIARVA